MRWRWAPALPSLPPPHPPLQPLSRPLTNAPIPALPSSLLALSPSTIHLPSPPSPPLSLPLASACLTPAVLTSLWRLYLSPATPAPGTACRDGGEGRKAGPLGGGVVGRAAEWLWGPAGRGDGRGVMGGGGMRVRGGDGGVGRAGKDTSANCYRHAHSATASAPLPAAAASHTAAPPSAGREDTGQCESRAHCSTDKSRALDCNTENATTTSSSSRPACQHRAPWEARRPAAVAAVLHVLQLLAHRWPPALSEITRELLPLQRWPFGWQSRECRWGGRSDWRAHSGEGVAHGTGGGRGSGERRPRG
ncbi:hypothetical protein CLOM_g2248 [Closterium sp. NIES-68]|nr:hypothetical protein CLOM_g2248 [Closterium sp. NIES-68]GJP58049.1 hypothetical protein CLOP_g20156 [Closterium sp. NIES-67]